MSKVYLVLIGLLFVLMGWASELIAVPVFAALSVGVVALLVQSLPQNTTLPAVALKPAKVILNISLWACIAFCLKSYQASILCLNCIKSYLARDISFFMQNGLSLHTVFNETQTRFWTMAGIAFVLIASLFVMTLREKRK